MDEVPIGGSMTLDLNEAINRPTNFVNIGRAEYYIKIGTVFLATRTRPHLLGRLFLKSLGISFVSEKEKELFQEKFLELPRKWCS